MGASVRKVCFVVPQAYLFFNPARGTPFGGAERQAYYIGTELALRPGYQVHYCVADFGQGEREEREGCVLWPAFSFAENRVVAFRKLLTTLRQIDADIYVFRGANPAIFPLVLYIRGVLRKKCIYMVAARAEGSWRQLARMAGRPTAFAMVGVYRSVDALCVQTHEQAAAFGHLNRSGTSLVANIFRAGGEMQWERRFDFSLWVGRSNAWKRPELFLEMARRHPAEKFVMICPAGREPERFRRLQATAASLGNVDFLAGVGAQELPAYYRRAKMYVLTSVDEGFSNTMMEAMACCCPILSLDVDPDGIIERHRAGLVSHELKTLFRDFSSLASDPQRCRLLGENGRRYLLENHVGQQVISRFAAVLEM